MVYEKHVIWRGKDKIMKQTAFCLNRLFTIS